MRLGLQQWLIHEEALVVKEIGAVCCLSGKLIATLVKWVTCVAFDPLKTYLMVFHGGKQTLPKVYVFDRLFRSRFPAFSNPPLDPFLIKRINYVL